MYYTSDLKDMPAGPTWTIVGQHWTSTAPMSRVCRDVYRNVWLYNLDYNRVVGVNTPLFSRSAIYHVYCISQTVGYPAF